MGEPVAVRIELGMGEIERADQQLHLVD